jgi:hypothetical protein
MFYDISHRQWVTCTRSYPHDVKKDGYLLLRRPSVKRLVDFDDYLSLALEKPLHFRYNLVHDRTYVKNKLHEYKKKPITSKFNHYERTKPAVSEDDSDGGVSVIEVSDDEPPRALKRAARDDSVDDRPSQRRRCGSIASMCTSVPSSPSLPPSPSPCLKIFVPDSSKQWPHGMFAVDMKKAFLLVDSIDLKGLKLQTSGTCEPSLGNQCTLEDLSRAETALEIS